MGSRPSVVTFTKFSIYFRRMVTDKQTDRLRRKIYCLFIYIDFCHCQVHQGFGTTHFPRQFLRTINGPFVPSQHQSRCWIWHASVHRGRFERFPRSHIPSGIIVHKFQRGAPDQSSHPLCTYVSFCTRYYKQR